MAVLDHSESPEDLRRHLIEEAEEYRRRHPLPPLAEVVDEIIQDGAFFRPADFGAPDSLTLLRETRGYEEPTGRSALNCSPEDLVNTSWEWMPDSLLDRAGTAFPVELKRQLIEEAEKYRRRHPVPSLKELVDEITREGTFTPADFGAPDCVELIREDRDR